MARLWVEGREQDGVEFDAECRIGREASNDMVLAADHTVSREHARIRSAAGVWLLSDLSTRNGTFLERQGERRRVSEVELQADDVILVGDSRLRMAWSAGTETQLVEPGLTQVPGATRVGQPLVPPAGTGVPQRAAGKPWWRRILGRG